MPQAQAQSQVFERKRAWVVEWLETKLVPRAVEVAAREPPVESMAKHCLSPLPAKAHR